MSLLTKAKEPITYVSKRAGTQIALPDNWVPPGAAPLKPGEAVKTVNLEAAYHALTGRRMLKFPDTKPEYTTDLAEIQQYIESTTSFKSHQIFRRPTESEVAEAKRLADAANFREALKAQIRVGFDFNELFGGLGLKQLQLFANNVGISAKEGNKPLSEAALKKRLLELIEQLKGDDNVE